jgi:hypothetical protein
MIDKIAIKLFSGGLRKRIEAMVENQLTGRGNAFSRRLNYWVNQRMFGANRLKWYSRPHKARTVKRTYSDEPTTKPKTGGLMSKIKNKTKSKSKDEIPRDKHKHHATRSTELKDKEEIEHERHVPKGKSKKAKTKDPEERYPTRVVATQGVVATETVPTETAPRLSPTSAKRLSDDYGHATDSPKTKLVEKPESRPGMLEGLRHDYQHQAKVIEHEKYAPVYADTATRTNVRDTPPESRPGILEGISKEHQHQRKAEIEHEKNVGLAEGAFLEGSTHGHVHILPPHTSQTQSP